MSQSLFYWIIYSYNVYSELEEQLGQLSQSLFYWIIYSYFKTRYDNIISEQGLNPYFIGLSILIC